MTHKGLGVTCFETTFANGQKPIVKTIVFAESLINYENGNKTFRDELKKSGIVKIDMNKYINEFEEAINSLVFDIFSDFAEEIIKSFKSIKETIVNDCFNDNNAYFKDKKNKPHGLLKSLNNFINIFSNELIYRNKIQNNPDNYCSLYKLFLRISEIYFGKQNLCVCPSKKYI